ncbi:MAG: EAL domain-containing protein [Anaerolineaceae bacterium]
MSMKPVKRNKSSQDEPTHPDVTQRMHRTGDIDLNTMINYSHAPVMMHTIDNNGRIIRVNDYWKEHLGYQQEEILGKNIAEFLVDGIPETEKKKNHPELCDLLSCNDIPLCFQHKNGKHIDVLYSSVADKSEEGKPFYSYAVLIDVSSFNRTSLVQEALYKISQAAHSVRNLSELYFFIHSIVADLMPARNLYIALIEPSDNLIHFVYWVDEFDPMPGPRQQGGTGLTDYVLRTGKSLLISGENSFEELVQTGEVDSFGSPSIDWLGMPLLVSNAIIGVMVVQSYNTGVRYTEEHKDILEFVSEQIASAIVAKRADEAIRKSEQKYRSIVSNMEDGVLLIDEKGIIAEWNKGMESITRIPRDDFIGKNASQFHQMILPQSSERFKDPGIFDRMIRELLETGETRNGEHFTQFGKFIEGDIVDRLGEIRSLQITYSPIKTDQGFQILCLARDTTERKRAELALVESETRYALAVQGANDGIWDWNLQTNTIYYSPRWKAMLGFNDDEIGDSPDEWFGRIHPEDIEGVNADIKNHLEGHTSHFANEHRIFHRDGFYRWVLARGNANWDSKTGTRRMAGSLSDVTARKVTEERLLHDALHDPLTGLHNRIFFMDQLLRAIDRSHRRNNYQAAVLYLDLDRFKIVNDSLGHAIGDSMLISIAERLQTSLRTGDTLARLGGDEFAILLDDIVGIQDATRVAERLQQSLELPFNLFGHEVFATASIGIAQTSTGYERAEDMLRDADTALYRAKAAGRARYALFDTEMHAQNLELLQLEAELRRATEREEFVLYFQPVVNLRSGIISSFEALIRWQHPMRGLVFPHEFIPLAEETGLILPIGEWVLRQACKQAKTWVDTGYQNIPIAVNLSARQLQDPKLPELVQSIMQEVGVPSNLIHLEITESAAMQDITVTIRALETLHAVGLQFSIDDFGTSYSSLSYLQRFPVTRLKIDQSFIWDIHEATDESGIITAIIAMGHILNLSVTAEGVETMRQLEFLQSKGCDDVQGFLISSAVSEDEASKLLAKRQKLLPSSK